MARGGTNHKGGRPKGSKTAKTLERERVLEGIRQRTMQSADILFNAQISLAKGQAFLYVIRTVQQGKVAIKQKAELIEDPEVIQSYLDGDLDGIEDEYYYITTKEPSNSAIDSMYNRTFGKPKDTIELGGKDGEPIKVTVINYSTKKNES